MRQTNLSKNERGMALILSLLALLLISAVGLGLVYMSNTETSINANYKDTQAAFFAMRAGLEEGRDRLRANSLPVPTIPLPILAPPAAGSVVYILNSAGGGDVVAPTTAGNQYIDDEFCHESFGALPYVAPGTGTCPAADVPPVGSFTTMLSASPNTGTAAALKYKWVRITIKTNGTFPSALVDPSQNSAAGLASPVCWDGTLLKEEVASALGYATCQLAKNPGGLNVMPVYLITSLAVTPSGSRRIGQYEAGAFMITPPAGGLDFAGPNAQFNSAPNSNNFGISGCNSGDPANNAAAPPPCTNAYVAPVPAGPGGPGSCTVSTPTTLPAIAVGDAQGASNMTSQIPNNRTGNYTGSTPLPGTPPAPSTPSVQNEGVGSTQYPSNNVLGPSSNWSTPAQMNALAQSMANAAILTCPGSAACSGATFGSDAAPQITYINGDATVGGGAGVLVVTGTLTFNGNTNFDGIIMVIGQGVLNVHGGGGGQINGEVLIANTNSRTAPFGQLATLGPPTLNWTGGGSNFLQYNSCWADFGSFINYTVVASREEMY
jgi:hypothetical protein